MTDHEKALKYVLDVIAAERFVPEYQLETDECLKRDPKVDPGYVRGAVQDLIRRKKLKVYVMAFVRPPGTLHWLGVPDEDDGFSAFIKRWNERSRKLQEEE